MPFNAFKSLRAAAERTGLRLHKDTILPELAYIVPEESLTAQLSWVETRRKSSSGEMFMREFYIAPIMLSALHKREYLNIWANDYALFYTDEFSGYPDYLITGMRNPKAAEEPEQKPYLAVAEAKKENFDEGWGQCLAEMYACRQLNELADAPIWGIVSTGETWQFGKLIGDTFTRHVSSVDLDPLGKLLAILDYIFGECEAAARKAAETRE